MLGGVKAFSLKIFRSLMGHKKGRWGQMGCTDASYKTF